MINDVLIDQLIAIVEEAHSAIMAVYGRPAAFEIQHKLDDSPVTSADKAANAIILAGLQAISSWPIISEEMELPSAQERQAQKTYWLVDPLDGTRGFIAQTDDFTVNIALMHNNKPLLGVVGIPISGEIFVGVNKPHEGYAFKQIGNKRASIQIQPLHARQTNAHPLRLWVSRYHRQERLEWLSDAVRARLAMTTQVYGVGSSLKFCRLAEGEGDLYLRFGPTSEWDVAAGQAVLAGAGGNVYGINTSGNLHEFFYNKTSILNGPFCAIADDKISDKIEGVIKQVLAQMDK